MTATHATRHRTAADVGALLGDRTFVALFIAHLGSNLGDWLAFLALYERVALEWHASAGAMAALAAAYLLPLVLVAPIAGVCIERWELRRVLVASDLLRGLVVLTMLWTTSVAGVAALLFALQSLGCFFNPAQAAALPRLVRRERLLAANALTSQAGHLAKILGPAIAGTLVGAFGAGSCFVIDAVSFAWSAVWLATLPRMQPLAPRSATLAGRSAWRSVPSEMRAGFAIVLRPGRIRAAVGRALLTIAALGAWLALYAVLARDLYGAGARATGFLLSTLGAGAIAGAAIVLPIARRGSKLAAVTCGMAAVALALGAFAWVAHLPAAFAASFALGIGIAFVLVPATTLLQEEAPPAALARVMSCAVAAIGLAEAISIGAAGLAARRLPPQQIVGGAAILLGAATLVILMRAKAGAISRRPPPAVAIPARGS